MVGTKSMTNENYWLEKEGSEYFILENKMRNGYTLLESEE